MHADSGSQPPLATAHSSMSSQSYGPLAAKPGAHGPQLNPPVLLVHERPSCPGLDAHSSTSSQCPPVHTMPAPHACPHPPQFAGSLAGSTQRPSHASNGAPHSHAPARQLE